MNQEEKLELTKHFTLRDSNTERSVSKTRNSQNAKYMSHTATKYASVACAVAAAAASTALIYHKFFKWVVEQECNDNNLYLTNRDSTQ